MSIITLNPLAGEARILVWDNEPEWMDAQHREAYEATDPEGLTVSQVTRLADTPGYSWIVKATSKLSDTPEVLDAGGPSRTVNLGLNSCERVVRELYAERQTPETPEPVAENLDRIGAEIAATLAEPVDVAQFVSDYVAMLEKRPAKRELVKEIKAALADRGVTATNKTIESYL